MGDKRPGQFKLRIQKRNQNSEATPEPPIKSRKQQGVHLFPRDFAAALSARRAWVTSVRFETASSKLSPRARKKTIAHSLLRRHYTTNLPTDLPHYFHASQRPAYPAETNALLTCERQSRGSTRQGKQAFDRGDSFQLTYTGGEKKQHFGKVSF